MGGVCALALVACQAGAPRPAATPGSIGPVTVVERAETGPITAIAGHAPSLWALGAPGLRRWDVTSGDWELVGEARLAGARIAALAADDDGNAWVAMSGEIGRFVAGKGGTWKYESTGSPGEVTTLAARAPSKGGGAWAGGAGGLFRYDGHRWAVIDGLGGAGVSWLRVAEDGLAVWVGTRGQGLFRADDHGATRVPGGEGVGAPELVGLATTAAGTQVAAGNFEGQGRLYALTQAGTVELVAPAGVAARALLERGGDAVLIAGPPASERAYHLQPLEPGQPVPSGGLRFAPAVTGERDRWAAVPIDLAVPPGITVATEVGGEIYCGTTDRGVARAKPGRPDYLEGSELVGDAERFSIACLAQDRCLVVTDAGHAWRTDGARYEKTSVGETGAAQVLGVVADPHGSVYAISSEPPWKNLTITRREAAKDAWQPSARIGIELPPRTTPALSFLAISPAGTLWAGVRAASDGGEDVGDGALEVDLQTGIGVHHRPRRAGEAVPVESLPLPADLEDVLFDGSATWFASLSGVCRFQQGQLESWGESDGLPSELVWGIARGTDGAVVAATSEGLARWDGHAFHPFGGERFAVHGVATDDAGTLWAATSKGLRPVRGDQPLDGAANVVDGNLRDVTRDVFGRIWALTSNAIALVTPGKVTAAKGP